MPAWLAVGIGGFLGAIARFQIGEWLNDWSQQRFGRVYPAGTFAVNMLGCLLIGVLMMLFLDKQLSDRARLIWITGCLGSLTTFSTFGFETVALIREEKALLAVLNITANVVIGLLAVAIGIALARLALR